MTGFDLASWLAQTAGVSSKDPPAPAPAAPAPAVTAAVPASASTATAASVPSASSPVPATTVHGASALAAAVVAGDQQVFKPGPDGVELRAGGDVFDIDGSRESMIPQLQVAPITMVKTEYRLQVVHQIATNSSYICYALKAGQIRVLNKSTTNRALFRGHLTTITDMMFCSVAKASNMLASCDQAGELFVRKIVEESPDASITEEVLVHHKFNMSDKATKRLAWHPTIEGLLAVAAMDRVSLVNVPPTSGVAKSAEFASPCSPASAVTEGYITSVAFNEAGDLLAAADNKGFVFVWSLSPHDLASAEEGGQTLQPLSPEPDIMFRAYDDDEFAATLDFLPSRSQKSILVTGCSTARILKLWTVHIEDKPCCTYTLELTSSKEGPRAFFNHMLVMPHFSVVVLANTKRQQVYVLHAKQDPETDAPSFDYLSDFSVVQPILSMTTSTEPSYEDGEPVLHLYCVQTEAIQQYTLYPDLCFPQEADSEEPMGVDLLMSASLAEAHGQPGKATVLAAEAAAAKLEAASPVAEPLPAAADLAPGKVESLPAGPDTEDVLSQPRLLSPSSLLRETLERSAGVSATNSCDGVEVDAAAAKAEAPKGPVTLTERALAANAKGAGMAAMSHLLVGKLGTGSSEASDAASPFIDVADADKDVVAAAPCTTSEHGSTTAADGPPAVGAAPPADIGPSSSDTAGSIYVVPSLPPPPSDLMKKRLLNTPAVAASPTSTASTATATKAGPAPASPAQKQPKKKGAAATTPLPPQPSLDLAAASTTVAGVPSSLAPPPPSPPRPPSAPRSSVPAPASTAAAGELTAMLTAQQQLLHQVLLSQQDTIKQMKAELARQAKANELSISKAVDSALKAQSKSLEEARAKDAKREKEENNKQMQKEMSTLLKEITKEVHAQMHVASRNITTAVVSAVVPEVSNVLHSSLPSAIGGAPVQQALERVMSSQMRTALPRAVTDGITEAFTAGAVVASFESAAQVMFSQIDAAFRGGMAEHLQKASGSTSEIAASMRDSVEQMRQLVHKLSTPAPPAVPTSAPLCVSELEARPPPPDPKTQISALLHQGQFDQAFNAALSTMDVEVTLWLCKQLDPVRLCSAEPFPLSQVVLLSLITHLGQNLSIDTEVKLSWICEAAPALDPKGQHFVLHARGLLEPIKSQLVTIAKSSSGDTGRLAKTTVHLVNSLLHQ